MNRITATLLAAAVGFVATAAVTAAVTRPPSEGAGLGKYAVAEQVTVWVLDIDDPQDNIPFRYPRPFGVKEVCDSFIESDEGQRTILNLRLHVLREHGPGYKLGEPLCRQVVMDRPSLPGVDI